MSGHCWLFVPGHRPSRFERARASGAAVVICDLEDGVPDDQKGEARENIRSWLEAEGSAWVRINGAGTPWHEQDIAALSGAVGLAGWVLPKVEKAADLDALDGTSAAVAPIIESAAGTEHLESILCHPPVATAILGTVDLAADLGVDHDAALLDHVRARLVIASRATGRPAPIDGVTLDFADPVTAEADARKARRSGFGGKLAIHPDQIAAIERGFRPEPEAVERARRTLAGAGAGGAVAVGGVMVDAPVVARARQILAAAGAEQEDESR
ncbi:HpcH/HpaI aldolase/citrate lyase family protein [Kribbella sp. NPDC048928]|uniref:HpcH/HpaI aldolase/citrate lyase family protein n=1 Tax=Kribbella sp. NPDC048928 TaxID=3364111 RepID=UPI00371AB6BD